jgi:hypothetical protein
MNEIMNEIINEIVNKYEIEVIVSYLILSLSYTYLHYIPYQHDAAHHGGRQRDRSERTDRGI